MFLKNCTQATGKVSKFGLPHMFLKNCTQATGKVSKFGLPHMLLKNCTHAAGKVSKFGLQHMLISKLYKYSTVHTVYCLNEEATSFRTVVRNRTGR